MDPCVLPGLQEESTWHVALLLQLIPGSGKFPGQAALCWGGPWAGWQWIPVLLAPQTLEDLAAEIADGDVAKSGRPASMSVSTSTLALSETAEHL